MLENYTSYVDLLLDSGIIGILLYDLVGLNTFGIETRNSLVLQCWFFLPAATEKTLLYVILVDQHASVTAKPCRKGCCSNSWLHEICNAMYTQHRGYTQHHIVLSNAKDWTKFYLFPSITLPFYWELSRYLLPSNNTKGRHNEALIFGPFKTDCVYITAAFKTELIHRWI